MGKDTYQDPRASASDEHQTYEELVTQSVRSLCLDANGVADWKKHLANRLERTAGKEYVRRLRGLVALRADMRLLDVGAGWGEFLYELKGLVNAQGIEPDPERIVISRMLDPKLRITHAVGESLPFEDDSFDIVTSFTVLEHVDDVAKTLHEMIRVCRPGGTLFIMCPNYLFPFEEHYEIFWPPLLPKPLGRAYLRLRGRNPAFINHIKYVTSWGLRRILCKEPVNVIDLSAEEVRRNGKKKGALFGLLGSMLATTKLYQGNILLLKKHAERSH